MSPTPETAQCDCLKGAIIRRRDKLSLAATRTIFALMPRLNGSSLDMAAAGWGGLAVIDPSTRSKVGDISLKAHPESFQIDPDTSQIFVNVPGAHGIAVVD